MMELIFRPPNIIVFHIIQSSFREFMCERGLFVSSSLLLQPSTACFMFLFLCGDFFPVGYFYCWYCQESNPRQLMLMVSHFYQNICIRIIYNISILNSNIYIYIYIYIVCSSSRRRSSSIVVLKQLYIVCCIIYYHMLTYL